MGISSIKLTDDVILNLKDDVVVVCYSVLYRVFQKNVFIVKLM